MVQECIILQKNRLKWSQRQVRMVPDKDVKNPLRHVDIELSLRVIIDLVTVMHAEVFISSRSC